MLIVNLYRYEVEDGALVPKMTQLHNPVINAKMHMWEIETGRIKVVFSGEHIEREILTYRDLFSYGKVIDLDTSFEYPFFIDKFDYYPEKNMVDILSRDIKNIYDVNTRLDFTQYNNETQVEGLGSQKSTIYEFKEVDLALLVKEINNAMGLYNQFYKQFITLRIDREVSVSAKKISEIGNYTAESMIVNPWRLLRTHLLYNDLFLLTYMDDDGKITFEIRNKRSQPKGLLVEGYDKMRIDTLMPTTNHTVASIKYNTKSEQPVWVKTEEPNNLNGVIKVYEIPAITKEHIKTENQNKIYKKMKKYSFNQKYQKYKWGTQGSFTDEEKKGAKIIKGKVLDCPKKGYKNVHNPDGTSSSMRIGIYAEKMFKTFFTKEHFLDNIEVGKYFYERVSIRGVDMGSDDKGFPDWKYETSYCVLIEITEKKENGEKFEYYFKLSSGLKFTPRPKDLAEVHYYMDIDGKIIKSDKAEIISNIKYPVVTRYYEDNYLAKAQVDAFYDLVKYQKKYSIEWIKDKEMNAEIYDLITVQMRKETLDLPVIGYKIKNIGSEIILTYLISDSRDRVSYIVYDRNFKIITDNSRNNNE